MKLLEMAIRQNAKLIPPDTVKVSTFLNHQLDTALLMEIGKEFHRLFHDAQPTKILTIETSGIAYALMAALNLGAIPVVYALKHHPVGVNENCYLSTVFSMTHKTSYLIHVDKKLVSANDRLLIIDDFLANGQSAKGLLHIAKQSGATVVAYCSIIEKAFQKGRDNIKRDYPDVPIYSLANIEKITSQQIYFVGESNESNKRE